MNVEDALAALDESPDSDSPVILLQNDRGNLRAAPVTAVVLDENNQDVSLLRGEFAEEDAALDGAIPVGEVQDALREVGTERASWPLYSAAADETAGEGAGGSLVGYSTGKEVEVFAFLEGPESAWEGA